MLRDISGDPPDATSTEFVLGASAKAVPMRPEPLTTTVSCMSTVSLMLVILYENDLLTAHLSPG
jgi:hypothetical protein